MTRKQRLALAAATLVTDVTIADNPVTDAPTDLVTTPEPGCNLCGLSFEAHGSDPDAPCPTPDPAPATDAVAPAPATPSAPVYWANSDRTFTPRRGFETVLYAALADQRTEAELVAHLLSSGDYARVAPRAAELRPNKPTRFLLKTWTAAGVVRKSAN